MAKPSQWKLKALSELMKRPADVIKAKVLPVLSPAEQHYFLSLSDERRSFFLCHQAIDRLFPGNTP